VPRRPLVGLTLSVILGTWLGLRGAALQAPVLAGAAGALLLAVLLRRSARRVRSTKPAVTALIHLSALATAWVWAGTHTAAAPREREPPLSAGAEERRLEVTGVVAEEPRGTSWSDGNARLWVFPLKVEEWKGAKGSGNGRAGRLDVLWFGPPDGRVPQYGERWRMTGTLRPDPAAGSGRSRGPALSVNGRRARFLSAGHGSWFVTGCLTLRRRAAALLAEGIEDYPLETGIFQALVLGYRSRLDAGLREVFVSTGTLHIFAISGLHVGIVCGIILFLLAVCRISRIYWIVFLAPLLTAYTVATGARPSAVRACVMALIYACAPACARRADGFSTLAAAALVIVAWAPEQLHDVGFVCSFVVAAGLLLLFPPLDRALRRWWEPDPFRIAPERKTITRLRGAWRWVVRLGILSFSAWVSSAPLTLYFFGRVCPVALASNLVVVPVAFLIVVSGSLSILSGSCAAALGDLFNHASLGLILILVRVIRWMAAVPGGNFRIGGVPLWPVLLWYAAVGALLIWIRSRASGQPAGDKTVEFARQECENRRGFGQGGYGRMGPAAGKGTGDDR